MDDNFLVYLQGRGQGFNPYSAGSKQYNSGLMSSPNIGPVDKLGYRQRDKEASTRRNALLRRLQAQNRGNYMSSANLTPQQGNW